eukprot:6202568-Pleurochrysis_carterae.AAC.1
MAAVVVAAAAAVVAASVVVVVVVVVAAAVGYRGYIMGGYFAEGMLGGCTHFWGGNCKESESRRVVFMRAVNAVGWRARTLYSSKQFAAPGGSGTCRPVTCICTYTRCLLVAFCHSTKRASKIQSMRTSPRAHRGREGVMHNSAHRCASLCTSYALVRHRLLPCACAHTIGNAVLVVGIFYILICRPPRDSH